MTYLNLEDTTVLKFDFEKRYYEILKPELLPFSMRGRISDTTKANSEDLPEIWFNNQDVISKFFYNRSLSVNRENAKYIMNQLGIKQNNDFESRYKAMMLCKGLSVADSYWITDKDDEKWKDVCLKNNPLHETLQQIALFGRSLIITGELRTPEITGQGAYAKAWYRENDRLFLYKAIGTKWIAIDFQELDVYSPKTISFEKDKFFWGDKTYSIDFNKNFFLESEIDEDLIPHNLYNPIYFLIDNIYVAFSYCYNKDTGKFAPQIDTCYLNGSDEKRTDYLLDQSYTDNEDNPSAGDDEDVPSTGEDENFELSGEYVISETHRFGNLVFSNGSWSVTQSTSSGTYSLNNNVLTVSYDVYGTSVSADFKVSVSGSEITFEALDSNFAAVLGGFGVQDKEALETGKITLTKN